MRGVLHALAFRLPRCAVGAILVPVPQFAITSTISTREVSALRCSCDGCDWPRLREEACDHASLWLVTAGAFELRERTGARILDPTRAIVLPAHHPFTVRHPVGPDVCVAFRGPLIDRLAERGPREVPISATLAARLGSELAAWRQTRGDALGLTEALADLASVEPVHADRDLAGAISHALRLQFADSTSLQELADAAGYSVFHTCRVFRQTTGQTIHGFRRELRLRHALARLLDGDEPLVDIAEATGFASQSHLTNLFRARFGVTPARARTRDGQRRLTRSR